MSLKEISVKNHNRNDDKSTKPRYAPGYEVCLTYNDPNDVSGVFNIPAVNIPTGGTTEHAAKTDDQGITTQKVRFNDYGGEYKLESLNGGSYEIYASSYPKNRFTDDPQKVTHEKQYTPNMGKITFRFSGAGSDFHITPELCLELSKILEKHGLTDGKDFLEMAHLINDQAKESRAKGEQIITHHDKGTGWRSFVREGHPDNRAVRNH